MLNSCFDKLYRTLGLRGGDFYPYFVAVVIVPMNISNLFRQLTFGLTPSLKVVTRIESILFLFHPMICILESRLRWERYRMHEDALERIKEIVGSKTKYNTYSFVQQVLLLVHPGLIFFIVGDMMAVLAAIPLYLAFIINYASVVRYSSVIWTIQDLFRHLNYRLEESLACHRSYQECAISRICTIHQLLVDHATELNSMFQIQMLLSLLLITVRCLIYPSMVLLLWLDPQEGVVYRCYYVIGMIIIDLIHVTNIFHPASMAVLQASKTCKILRSIANKQIVDSEMVMQYITTRLFILMTF